jgi:hypothetical protein
MIDLDRRRTIALSPDLRDEVKGPVQLSPGRARTVRVILALRPSEQADLQSLAAKHGLPLATFCRELLLVAKGAVK